MVGCGIHLSMVVGVMVMFLIIIISMLSEMNMGMAARKNHPEKAIPTPSVVEKKRRQVNLKFHEGLGVSA